MSESIEYQEPLYEPTEGEVERWAHKWACDRAESLALEFVRIAEDSLIKRSGSYKTSDAIRLASIVANLYIGLELKEKLDSQQSYISTYSPKYVP